MFFSRPYEERTLPKEVICKRNREKSAFADFSTSGVKEHKVELTTVYMCVGFLLAAYSVIANDAVQTLGTFLSSNSSIKWQYMWAFTSSLLVLTLLYGWTAYGGDISFGRLNKIPFQETQWYHALAPAVLLVLTRIGIPVSTSFLVLSAFASTFVLEKMLMKSIMGYGIAAIFAYVMWFVLARYLDEKRGPIAEDKEKRWRVAQWGSTALLWFMWLSHDVANIAVFLPRQLSFESLLVVMAVFVILLGFMFSERGGKIQEIVKQKSDIQYVRSATVVGLVYAFVLWFFKEYNDIPMSTTWVFVGLLAGRELAIGTVNHKNVKGVWPLVRKDFMKMMVGLGASVAVAMFVHEMTT